MIKMVEIDPNLQTIISLIISNHKGLVYDYVEDKTQEAFKYLFEETIRSTHGMALPAHIRLELQKQLNAVEINYDNPKFTVASPFPVFVGGQTITVTFDGNKSYVGKYNDHGIMREVRIFGVDLKPSHRWV